MKIVAIIIAVVLGIGALLVLAAYVIEWLDQQPSGKDDIYD